MAILKNLPYFVDFQNIQNKGFSLESNSKAISVSSRTHHNLKTLSLYCSLSIYFLAISDEVLHKCRYLAVLFN